ncbi:hypothetical protein OA503_05020 [Prochlorococcus sp. AH-716-K03]|nr:hypothetical protein [Prochlorococcus sp. AH-716-K03]
MKCLLLPLLASGLQASVSDEALRKIKSKEASMKLIKCIFNAN